MERLPAFCVPVPFETEWAKATRQDRSPKRATPAGPVDGVNMANDSSPNAKKRPLGQDDVSMDDVSNSSRDPEAGPATTTAVKRSKDQVGTESKTGTNNVTHDYLPDPSEKGICCIAKVRARRDVL
jgi:hypothetical protein